MSIQLPNIDESRSLYTKYGKIYLANIETMYGAVENGMKLKINHGISMSKLVPNITSQSGLFNESYLDSAAIDGLFHDIGRFVQYLLTNSLKDVDLEKKFGIVDHGRLGKILLQDNDLLHYFHLENYASILRPVIGNHTNIYDPKYDCDLSDLPLAFQNYSMEEVIKNEELKKWLIAAKIKLVVEADGFELIQNIVNRDWVPTISEERGDWITDPVWERFINNQPIMIAEMKNQNAWTCNSGFALRNGLLPQKAQLRATLEVLLQKDYLRKVYERAIEGQEHPDPRIKECYLYTQLLVENIVSCSDPIIKPEQRWEAVQKTKTMYKG